MRRALLAAALAVVLLAGAVAALALYRRHQGRDVRGSSTVEFVTRAAPRPPKPPPEQGIVWPTYGYSATRDRDVASALRPPFRRVWTWHGRSLLEFPPAIAYGRLYLTTFDGRFVELDRRTGRALWIYTSHRCGWASPAVAGRLVYVTFIGRAARCNARVPGTDGELVAFAADSHRVRIRWRLHLGPTESSPLVAGGLVYVGDWRGKVYAVDRLTGKVRWTFATGGKIKGSAALAGGRVFIGSYDGHVYALDARTGRLRWRASAQPRFGSTGTFYATPAVAFGRVYVGSTDGKVYSFGATSGRLLWSQGTGGYVYSSAAVSGRLVLVGSYDHRFYALDAATGDVRWRFRADGPISGSATVLGNLVYFSTFATTTYALDVRTGRVVWTFRDGKYSPVVADADRVYLVGFGRLYALERPVRSAHAVRRHGGSRVRRVAPRRGAARGGAQRRRP